MKPRKPFYKNGMIVGLLIVLLSFIVASVSAGAAAAIMLIGAVVFLVSLIRFIMGLIKGRTPQANEVSSQMQSQLSSSHDLQLRISEQEARLNAINAEIAVKEQLLSDREVLFGEVCESMKGDAQKRLEEEYSDYSVRLGQLKVDVLEAQAKHDSLLVSIATAEKKLNTAISRNERFKTLGKSMLYAQEVWASGDTEAALAEIRRIDLEELLPEPDLQCLTMKALNARYKALRAQIVEVCKSYEQRYSTKANAVIYKLMVLAMEAELDNVLYKLQFGRLEVGISAVRNMTSKYYELATEGNQSIAPTLKSFIGQIESLYLDVVATEYEYYVQRERAKEEQRALREQMKQEAEERKQLERDRRKVEAEEQKYHQEMDRIRQEMQTAHDTELESLKKRLSEMQAMMDKVEERKAEIVNLQNGKAGTIYIISNIGSFGEGVFKVGMTRRLEPEERVNELGNASVPFPFDIHSFIFSDDAPALETALHKELNDRRVNKVNLRKEFFRVSIEELQALVEKYDPTAPFRVTALAEQYRQSLNITDVPDVAVEEVEDDDIA